MSPSAKTILALLAERGPMTYFKLLPLMRGIPERSVLYAMHQLLTDGMVHREKPNHRTITDAERARWRRKHNQRDSQPQRRHSTKGNRL